MGIAYGPTDELKGLTDELMHVIEMNGSAEVLLRGDARAHLDRLGAFIV